MKRWLQFVFLLWTAFSASAITRQTKPVISDIRGNALAAVTNGVVSWNPGRPTGYGAVPGYRPPALGNGASIALSSAWRGRWVDITGYYSVGLRPYDPVSGRWLTYDSVWNERDPNAYTFTGGDPINGFDSDGRCLENAGEKSLIGAAQFFLSGSEEEDAQPLDEQTAANYEANYKYYGNNSLYALNATFNPAVSMELNSGETFSGIGLNYNDSGQALNYSQQVNAGGNALLGLGQTAGTGTLLYGIGAVSVNAVDSYLSASIDSSLPSGFNFAATQGETLPQMGTVYVNPPPGATADQVQQVQSYVTGANQAVIADALSPEGRVSTAGSLRNAASLAAAAERQAAADAGTPYQGQVGHVPDTTWTGTPVPFMWLDLDPRVNASIGGQANRYPLGFVPTDFQVGPPPRGL